ncbi:prepilin peptidase [Streptomyces sp. ISL-96]|uniref:prepilin peptidase n=1 Tax=Streptomyces sp. ISL-96 TaxID=2819191 RepID=UPI001BEB89A7|nr:A24 family peptidase [Streptomyces sp. ISL-96]MBT2489158.1 prepilin peptidase [Streptomyces sp. ISL-96]
MYATATATLIAAAALWGAAAGLLVPRAAYRLAVEPEEEWRAACPAGHPVTGPARGWVGIARCAECAAVVSAAASGRTPVGAPRRRSAPVLYAPTVRHAAVTALACALLAAASGARPELVVWLLLAPFAVLLAVVDRRVHRLPDVLTLPLAAATAALLGLASLLPGHGGSWPTALLGGVALGGGYLLLFLINPNGMGFGDVKLAVALGTALGWYGWTVFFAGAFAGFLLGAVYGLGLVVLRRAGRRTAIPFGPFMITGTLAGLLLGGLAFSAV